MSKVDISFIVINWNSGWQLPYCVPSLLDQSKLSIEIIIIDNNSSDNTKEIVKGLPENIKVIFNKENAGYSKAANQGIDLSKGKYVSIINPDVILNKNYSYEIVKIMDDENNIAAATGKLIKYDFKNNKSLEVLDSTGIEMTNSIHVYDRGQNSDDLNFYDGLSDVFGVSGAAPIYRKSSLEDIKINNEYFDEDFFAYKEDIDLSWRLRKYGWKIIYVSNAVAYHGRAMSKNADRSIPDIIKHRKGQSQYLRILSMRNHYCLLLKNFSFKERKYQLYKIILKEINRVLFCLFFEIRTLLGLLDFIKLIPKMLRKRKIIKKSIKNRKSLI